MNKYPIESLLSAKQVLSPQIVGDRIFFISDISGSYSLYSMSRGGSYPEALLPAGTALQNPVGFCNTCWNPHLIEGNLYKVFPKLNKILIMIDKDGDENYQPMVIPLEGGIPTPLFGDMYVKQQILPTIYDENVNIVYFSIDDRKNPGYQTIQVQLEDNNPPKVQTLGWSLYGNNAIAFSKTHEKVLLLDYYSLFDCVCYLGTPGSEERTLLLGTPMEEQEDREKAKKYYLYRAHFTNRGLLFYTTVFNEFGGFALLPERNTDIREVKTTGVEHKGIGELHDFKHLADNVFCLNYNIDGVTWLYEAQFEAEKEEMMIQRTIAGKKPLSNGVVVGWHHQKTPQGFEYVMSFTSATHPAQIYYTSSDNATNQLTKERVLGIPENLLSKGESYNYTSFDNIEISARLYLPSSKLSLNPPFPLVLYVHGGPQSQERPDFTWFSMPLIQYLTLNGFAVFVPNVRGSTGYGMTYAKLVDRDWGGKDLQDHLEGLKHLEKDPRIDSSLRAVVGRSYGGYMTLSLVARHPEFWKAGCDMFGPYNLITWIERVPPSWKVLIYQMVGHPERDKEFLIERSPDTYFNRIKAPLLIVQGRNDPRVVMAESEDAVNRLKEQGNVVNFMVFDDEGHDVIKFNNKVACYQRIVDFFKEHLK